VTEEEVVRNLSINMIVTKKGRLKKGARRGKVTRKGGWSRRRYKGGGIILGEMVCGKTLEMCSQRSREDRGGGERKGDGVKQNKGNARRRIKKVKNHMRTQKKGI